LEIIDKLLQEVHLLLANVELSPTERVEIYDWTQKLAIQLIDIRASHTYARSDILTESDI
jgi:acetolactate synthase small subunit